MIEADRVASYTRSLSSERPCLIDPSLEDPGNFIGYDWDSDPDKVLPVGLDVHGRGTVTIGLFALETRDDLAKGRLDTVLSLRFVEKVLGSVSPRSEIYQDALQELKRMMEPKQEYLGLVFCYVKSKGLQKYINDHSIFDALNDQPIH